MIMRTAFVILLSILTCASVCAQCEQPCPAGSGEGPGLNQIVTTSWFGLSGLYVSPTARTMNRGQLAIGFNESKHSEFVDGDKFTDRQVRGVVTYAVTNNLEIYGDFYNNLLTIPPGVEPDLDNEKFGTFGFKYKLLDEHPDTWSPAVAFAVRDLADSTDDLQSLQDVHQGRKFYLLASKRTLKNSSCTRFLDLHVGLTYNDNGFGGMWGFELTLSPSISLIAEGIWDSPFLDFREYGKNNQSGRYVFNPGLRIYPELIPGMALDLGFVGDSEFEFSFGMSYRMQL